MAISHLFKIYSTPDGNSTVKVVDGFELMKNKDEFVSIIGHSGCSKSTVLLMTSGLNIISEDGIVLDGKEIFGAGPDRGLSVSST